MNGKRLEPESPVSIESDGTPLDSHRSAGVNLVLFPAVAIGSPLLVIVRGAPTRLPRGAAQQGKPSTVSPAPRSGGSKPFG
jgi:hypothetical protein